MSIAFSDFRPKLTESAELKHFANFRRPFWSKIRAFFPLGLLFSQKGHPFSIFRAHFSIFRAQNLLTRASFSVFRAHFSIFRAHFFRRDFFCGKKERPFSRQEVPFFQKMRRLTGKCPKRAMICKRKAEKLRFYLYENSLF
jgi:hypothetical protein